MARWSLLLAILFARLGECVLRPPVVSMGELSACAMRCITTQLPTSGCPPTNITCLCTSEPYIQSVGACLKDLCTVREGLLALTFQKQSCNAPIRDAGTETRNVTWALYGVAVATVIGRLVFRNPRLKGSGYGWDDWTIIFSLIILTALNAVLTDMTNHGLGQDVWAIPMEYITRILKFFYHGEFLYIYIMTFTKISIVLLYLRIWTPPETGRSKFRICCFVLLGLLLLSALILSLFLGLECRPRSLSWTRWDNDQPGTCIDINALVFAMAGTNIALDILTFSLPIPQLLLLSSNTMPLRRKIGVSLLFLVGLFVTICSIIRLDSLHGWATNPNPTWHNNKTALWSMVECNLSVVCACLPSMAGLFQRVFGGGRGYGYGTGRSGEGRSRSGRHQLHTGTNGQEEEVRLSSVGYTAWGAPMRADSKVNEADSDYEKGMARVGSPRNPDFIDM